MIGDLARDAAPSSNPSSLTAAGDWVYFTAWDGTPLATSPNSIWRSDGTAEGTLRLGNFFAENLRTAGHSLYFTRSNVGWTSDGTPEGTVPFVSKNVSGQASVAFANGGTLFINGTDGLYVVSQTANAVPEPLGGVTGSRFINQAGRTFFIAKGAVWSSDGTRAGTYAAGPAFSEDIIAMASMGGSIYYVTRSANGTTKLWRNDGTFESNVLVKSLAAYDAVLAAGERRLFFLSGGQLWVSDGTEAGTQVLTSGAAYLSTLAVAGNRAIFARNDPANGTEPWVSDGTVAGTHLLRDISPGTLGSFPSDLTSVRGFVYFSAADDLHGNEVWVTDGTPEGTKLAADVEPGPTASFPHQYVEAGGRLFFTATTTATGNELWALPLPTAAPHRQRYPDRRRGLRIKDRPLHRHLVRPIHATGDRRLRDFGRNRDVGQRLRCGVRNADVRGRGDFEDDRRARPRRLESRSERDVLLDASQSRRSGAAKRLGRRNHRR